jgi:predicted phosphodiesterase
MMVWTDEIIEWARSELRMNDTTYDSVAAVLSETVGERISSEQLRSALRRRAATPVPSPLFTSSAVPRPAEPEFATPLEITSSRALVIADLHVPYHSATFLSRALSVAQAMSVNDVYIVGDLFDFSSLSNHPANEFRMSVDREIELAGAVLESIARAPFVKRIIITNGNHDERLAKRAGANILLRHIVEAAVGRRQLSCEVIVTEYDYVFHNSSWVLGHLSQFSKRPGEAARRIAEVYQRNVAVGHDHIQGFTSTADGQYLAISVGAMAHTNEAGRSSFWYKERRLNSYSPVVNGFLILDEDVPYLFNERGLSALNGGLGWEQVERRLYGRG